MNDIETIVQNKNIILFAKDLFKFDFTSDKDYVKHYDTLKKKYKLCPNKPTLNKVYRKLLKDGKIEENTSFLKYSLKKKVRSDSGVSVITILTSARPTYEDDNGNIVEQDFSCPHDCAYCPNEPEVRLTLKVEKILNDKFYVTTNDDIHLIRALTYIVYNKQRYKVNHCDLFEEKGFRIELKSCLPDFTIGEMILAVKEEQPRSYIHNEPAVLRANRDEFDATLQIYDRADALTNCGHNVDKIEVLVLGGTWDCYPIKYQESFIRDIYYSVNTLNKRFGGKNSLEREIKIAETSEKRIIGLTLETRPDYINLRQIRRLRRFNVTRLQIGVQHIDDDILQEINRGCYLKDTIRGNNLWKRNGGKIDWHLMPDLPGSSKEKDVFPWIRINRIVRDIPTMNIIGGNKNVNLHQKLLNRKDIVSDDIRCREVRRNTKGIENAELVVREYNGINSTEYFISYESPDKRILYGFLRLRINDDDYELIYKELNGCAFIRELHVYGQIVGHGEKGGNVQHMGFGKKMMSVAEDIVLARGLNKVAVISGVGVRQYYSSQGYKLVKDYMIKELQGELRIEDSYFLFTIILLTILFFIW